MAPEEKLNVLKKMLLTPFHEPGALYWKSIMIARRFVPVLLFCVITETSCKLFWMTLTCLLALFHHLRVKLESLKLLSLGFSPPQFAFSSPLQLFPYLLAFFTCAMDHCLDVCPDVTLVIELSYLMFVKMFPTNKEVG